MTKEKIMAALAEAERFIERANIALEAANLKGDKWNSWEIPKERGALRRASMDLTRSLAEMRKREP